VIQDRRDAAAHLTDNLGASRYRTVEIRAGKKILAAQDPLLHRVQGCRRA